MNSDAHVLSQLILEEKENTKIPDHFLKRVAAERIEVLTRAVKNIVNLEEVSRAMEIIELGQLRGEFQIMFGTYSFTFQKGAWSVVENGLFLVRNESSLFQAVKKAIQIGTLRKTKK